MILHKKKKFHIFKISLSKTFNRQICIIIRKIFYIYSDRFLQISIRIQYTQTGTFVFNVKSKHLVNMKIITSDISQKSQPNFESYSHSVKKKTFLSSNKNHNNNV